MKSQTHGGESIRLTNRTAKALRAQAKQQQLALHVTATVLTVALSAVAVVLGMRHLIAVPLTVLAIILLDALLILLARGRYVSLTGQAICTEAAARALRGQSAEQARAETAKRDLERIKEDLRRAEMEDEDDDLSAVSPVKNNVKQLPVRQMKDEGTRVMQPVHTAQRRRRQALPSDAGEQ